MSMPTDRVSASMVRLLKVKLKALIRAKVAMMDTGNATALIRVVRIFLKNMKTAITARIEPMMR